MKINDTYYAAPTNASDGAKTFAEEFGELLEQSSLGSANARAVRALSSPDDVDTVVERIANPDRGCFGDIDETLLAMVRNAAAGLAVPAPRDSMANTGDTVDSLPHEEGVSTDIAEHTLSVENFRRALARELEPRSDTWILGAEVSLGILQFLSKTEVFRYVRRDVARSVVEVVFQTSLPQGLLFLTKAVIESSNIVDEFVDTCLRADRYHRTGKYFRASIDDASSPGVEVLLQRRIPVDAIKDSGFVRLDPLMTEGPYSRVDAMRFVHWNKPGELRRNPRTMSPTRARVDTLIGIFERCAAHWFTRNRKSVSGQAGEALNSVMADSVSTTVLALLHGGPKSAQELKTAIKYRVSTDKSLLKQVQVLNRFGLIGREQKAGRDGVLLFLTDHGEKAFSDWLECWHHRGQIKSMLHLLGETSSEVSQSPRLPRICVLLLVTIQCGEGTTGWNTWRDPVPSDRAAKVIEKGKDEL
ncbi:hypothetical protein [Umezawaea sp. Da 62-37]|uniref:hypothetical protein n=1 Tax=Umezawaea sp. Da 62-37 TaxID=3075927 RepID=UPI0028F6D9D8|nr:hypothetical protein [Umezawaea sp. Da 62-37]WNV84894.1 hypothetical protein RM788_43165 [Umezawaea sp. Da 62-37]